MTYREANRHKNSYIDACRRPSENRLIDDMTVTVFGDGIRAQESRITTVQQNHEKRDVSAGWLPDTMKRHGEINAIDDQTDGGSATRDSPSKLTLQEVRD